MMRSAQIDDAIGHHGPGRHARLLVRCRRWLARMLDRYRQRSDLSELTDEQLADIGISRSQAKAEAAKPFWR